MLNLSISLPSVRKAVFVWVAWLVAPSGLFACSGPGAMMTIRRSERIGLSFAGLAFAIVAGGWAYLHARGLRGRIKWIVGSLVLHPIWWVSAGRGDCGFGLRYWSPVGTLAIGIVVALVLCWPTVDPKKAKAGRWAWSGAFAGALPGLAIASLMSDSRGPMDGERIILAWLVVVGMTLAGALIGPAIGRFRASPRGRFRFRLQTLLLFPLALAPMFAALLPVFPYKASVSTSAPFHFLILEEKTGRPISGATVQLIDPRFPLDDFENQGVKALSVLDGKSNYLLYANVEGREGLLGRTESISYDPLLVRVEAPGYRPFLSPLGKGPISINGSKASIPLGLTYPPPPSVTIHLRPQ